MVLKRKCFVILRLEKGRPQSQVLGFLFRAVPTHIVPERHLQMLPGPFGYLPVCLELMIY